MIESPCISSFVIRIVEEKKPHFADFPYRGIIRHVQTGQELSFTSWAVAEGFIQQYVPIHLMKHKLDKHQNDPDAE
jgi:hypothetical protein